MKKKLTLIITHGAALFIGFAAGIYFLPILIAPEAPAMVELQAVQQNSSYVGTFSRDRADSDALHWGEGEVVIGEDAVAFTGELAPGPDYRLYFSPQFVETEADFNQLKSTMIEVGPVRTFTNFLVDLPPHIDPSEYSAVIVWCETFGQFITSASYEAAP